MPRWAFVHDTRFSERHAIQPIVVCPLGTTTTVKVNVAASLKEAPGGSCASGGRKSPTVPFIRWVQVIVCWLCSALP